MSTINYNYAANAASNVINKNERLMDKTMAAISSGSKIGIGNNEPGSFSVHTSLKGQGVEARAGLSNINQGLAKLKLAESTAMSLVSIMERMRELAATASNAGGLQDDRNALDYEFQAQYAEYQRIVLNTRYNGASGNAGLLMSNNDGASGSNNIVISPGGGTAITHTMDDWSMLATAANGVNVALGSTAAGTASSGGAIQTTFLQTAVAASATIPGTAEENITTAAQAALTLLKLNYKISHAAAAVSRIGGYIQRTEFASDQAAGRAVAMEDAASKVGDTDYAVETAKLASQSIVSQAATAILAQANARSNTVLTLLK
ncbi:flagellin [Gammaproteobacteria bacterium]|nr:flagellin [Gammaproteobacteria bacterium]